jgi:phosphoribosylanthranilate isomerase
VTYIKICGLTNVSDALCAAEAGADMLGFIFYPPSPRYVSPARAAEIVHLIRTTSVRHAVQTPWVVEGPRLVGVFVDESPATVRRIMSAAGLDLAQLHGDEPPAVVQALAPYAFKALRPQTAEDAERALDAYRSAFLRRGDAPDLLVDAYHPARYGGTGEQADVRIAQVLSARCRLLLAGGLDPGNVAQAVRQVRPWGVDVSSGVEIRPGIKDHDRVCAFVQAVRAVDKELESQR